MMIIAENAILRLWHKAANPDEKYTEKRQNELQNKTLEPRNTLKFFSVFSFSVYSLCSVV